MFGFFETIFPVMFIAIFAIVIVTFIMTFVRGISQWNKNNTSPRLTVDAFVVDKRTNVSHHTSHHDHHHTSTTYYVTFQGARYLGFERQ